MTALLSRLTDFRFVRYLLASVGALAVDMGSFLVLLSLGMWAAGASAISYCLGIVAHWLMSSRAVFVGNVAERGAARTKQKALFVISALVGLGLTTAIVWAGDASGYDPRLAKLVAIAVSFVAVWVIRNRYIFGERQQSPASLRADISPLLSIKLTSKAKARERLWVIGSLIFATAIFSWPSLVNNGPFFIADTSAYIRSADAALSSQFDYNTIWSDKRDLYLDLSQQGDAATGLSEPQAAKANHPPLLGRSIYYGSFLYAPVILLGEHAGVFLQSALLALLVWLALVPIRSDPIRNHCLLYLGISLTLAVATPLPFTGSLLVPDYLTGIATAALVLLFCFWERFSKLEIGILAGLVCFAGLSHSSNLPLILAVTLAALILRSLGSRLSAKAAFVGIGALLVGFAGEAAFVAAVKHETGMSPVRPPFLTARLIADGPGHELLQNECSDLGLEVCRYIDRTPHDSDVFLWSTGSEGVFSAVDFTSQTRLSEQDLEFAISTFSAYPLATVAATIEATGRQLTSMRYAIWQGNEASPIYSFSNLPTPVAARMRETLNARGIMPIEPFKKIAIIVLIVSLLVGPICLFKAYRSDDPRLQAWGVALTLIAIAILANAAICGGLSKPDSRYTLKIVWILPLFIEIFMIQAIRNNRLLREVIERPLEGAPADEEGAA